MFKPLHVWSSKEAIGNEVKKIIYFLMFSSEKLKKMNKIDFYKFI